MDKSNWIEQLKKIAEEKYNEGHGYQVFVECYDKKDWEEFVGDLKTWAEALKMFERIADIRTEQSQAAQNEAF